MPTPNPYQIVLLDGKYVALPSNSYRAYLQTDGSEAGLWDLAMECGTVYDPGSGERIPYSEMVRMEDEVEITWEQCGELLAELDKRLPGTTTDEGKAMIDRNQEPKTVEPAPGLVCWVMEYGQARPITILKPWGKKGDWTCLRHDYSWTERRTVPFYATEFDANLAGCQQLSEQAEGRLELAEKAWEKLEAQYVNP